MKAARQNSSVMEELKSTVTSLVETRLGQFGVGALAVAGTVAASYYLSPEMKPITPMIDVQHQSIDLGDGVRGSPFLLNVKDKQPLKYISEDADTCYGLFLHGLKNGRDRPCVGSRTGPNKEYQFISYQEVYDRARAFGSGLIAIGLKPQPDTFIGIYSINRTEWVLTEIACYTYSLVSVALYDTLGPSACEFVVNHMEMTTVVVDNSEKAFNLLKKAESMPSLRTIIVMDEITDEVRSHAEAKKIDVYSFAEIEARGKSKLEIPVPPKPEDVATVSFTSGTTGTPKGVVLTHGNMAAEAGALAFIMHQDNILNEEDCHISYLPLAHLFERTVLLLLTYSGCHIGFFSGDILKLIDDIAALRPTLFVTVPRLLNRVRDKVYAGVQGSSIKSFLFNRALASKLSEIKRGIIRRNSIWDRLVFSRIQSMFGGRVKLIVTGSAPVLPETLDFFKSVLGCPILEGYGQTESVSGITATLPGDTTSGHVGGPLLCNLVKLIDVPEMEYFASENRGEICVKGPNVSPGYYKNPEKTADTFGADGWLRTGDVGMWLPNGALKLIDRSKHIFKLSQGEYVAPERIECIYVQSHFVGQVFVDGDSTKTSCMGVVVPDADYVTKWACNNGLPPDMDKLCQSEELKKAIIKDMTDRGKKDGLKGFEQVKDVYLEKELFSVENELLTPTFKYMRPKLRKKYASHFAELYKKNGL